MLNIDVSEVAKYIFEINTEKEIYLNVKSIKTSRDLFFFLFDIFCKGIIILYGENNKMKLNDLQPYQFDEIKQKLKFAHIKLNMEIFDIQTAVLLDLLPEEGDEYNQKNIIQKSIDYIMLMNDNEELNTYTFQLFMNDNLFCINFDIIH
jgi:ADP-glucose pyrophosphorylase